MRVMNVSTENDQDSRVVGNFIRAQSRTVVVNSRPDRTDGVPERREASHVFDRTRIGIIFFLTRNSPTVEGGLHSHPVPGRVPGVFFFPSILLL